MSELATVDQGGTIAHRTEQDPPQPAGEMSGLMLWAQEARQAGQVAVSLARTSFVPASLRVEARITPRMTEEEIAEAHAAAAAATAANITGAILTGNELGLQPMAALRSMDIIQGTPALRAHAMRGLVQSHGHDVELVESTPELCRMRGRRGGRFGTAKGGWQEITWTIERARQLGLAGKDQWKKQPQAMLVARATGELCRLIAADVLFAVPYAAEELDVDRPATVQATASAPVTAAEIMGSQPAVQQQAPSERGDTGGENFTADVTPPASAPTQHARPITTPQRTRLHATFGDLGYSGDAKRDDRLAALSAMVDRPLDSSNDLSLDEAKIVLDTLEGITNQAEEDRPLILAEFVTRGRAVQGGAA